LLIGSLLAQEKSIPIAFKDLTQLLEQSSPRLKIINAEKSRIKAKRDISLQWSNPELVYEREQVENSESKLIEHMVYLSKSFSLPWNYWKAGDMWDEYLNAADLDRQLSINQLLASARTEYVRLNLLKSLAEDQTELRKILNDLNQTISARQEEGAISQLQARLISRSTFGVEADILHTHREFRQAMINFKQILGIEPGVDVVISSLIRFKIIQIDSFNKADLLKNHPGMLADQSRIAALDRRVSLEKGRILPSIFLQGGYKKIDPGWEGYTLGLSLPIPLLNWNRAKIEEQKIEQSIQSAKMKLYGQQIQLEIDNLIEMIHDSIDLLQEHSIEQQNFKIVEDLLSMYRENVFSLPEFLNAIQIYRDSSRQYIAQLAIYYQTIFELEALSGQQLVTF
jgi:outer membrane protein TolC